MINACIHHEQESPSMQPLFHKLVLFHCWGVTKKWEKKKNGNLKHLEQLSFLYFLGPEIFLEFWVEFFFFFLWMVFYFLMVVYFEVVNFKVGWPSAGNIGRWRWPGTSKLSSAFYNLSGGIIDVCHHTWLALVIYAFFFFWNKRFGIYLLTSNKSV